MRDVSGPNIYMECPYIHAVTYCDVSGSMLWSILAFLYKTDRNAMTLAFIFPDYQRIRMAA